MKELISKLLTGQGKISLYLLQAKEFIDKTDDTLLKEFIDNELNGYSINNLPDYRKIKAEIVGDIQNSFGQLIFKDNPIDFSNISSTIGLDLSVTYATESISYLENILDNFKGPILTRVLHPQQIKMLNDIVMHNNPGMQLISASYQFSRIDFLNILDKVRQKLILGLRRNTINESVLFGNSSEINTINSKPVFVTYAWESDEFNDKVISFVDFLRKNGFNASMDRKESQKETSINFNRMMIEGIQNSDKVIVILTQTYKEKADKFSGGVGTEFQLILEQLKTFTNKFIFVSFGVNTDKIVPTGIIGREVLDLKKDQDKNNFNGLFSKLKNENIIEFSEVSENVVVIKKKDIKPFKL